MGRLNASISTLFGRDEAAGAASAGAGAAVHRPATRQPTVPDEVRRGPGWFESSWDLQRGLEVLEGLPADAKWHEWIEAYLRA